MNTGLIKNDEFSSTIHKDSSLKRLDKSFLNHINKGEYKTSNLLAYWINDFSEYHDNEKNFDNKSLRIFKRGSIIKVNLGFNIGNELGGLHYCVVINSNDTYNSGTLNVIPLTSIKPGKKYSGKFCLNLGDELYNLLIAKYDLLNSNFLSESTTISDKIKNGIINKEELEKYTKKSSELQKLANEINTMKTGSIALIQQITTISKQRIFKSEILNKIRLSDNSLDLIDEKIKNIFTKQKK